MLPKFLMQLALHITDPEYVVRSLLNAIRSMLPLVGNAVKPWIPFLAPGSGAVKLHVAQISDAIRITYHHGVHF
jgi:hypothetical protein